MKKSFCCMLAAVTAGAVVPMGLSAQTLTDALRSGETDLHLRLRYEDVDQDGQQDADALTLKTQLTFTSGNYNGFSGVLEMEDITALTDVDYNDGTNINTSAVIIPDPEGTEVNQAYLAYNNFDTTVRYGRQRILLDNQRFVGGVAWRQNEQTFDAVAVSNNTFAGLALFYAHVYNVNRVFGESVAAGDHKHQTHLFNGRYSGWQAGALVGYTYLIDNETAPALASNTYGLRWEGHVNDNIAYNLEYASQRDSGDNPLNYSADYMLAEGIVTFEGVKLSAGYEVLGSDDGIAAFSTPLATLHMFQGWTDKFLATPDAGVEDVYVGLAKKIGSFDLSVTYHTLSANDGSVDYGSETGFLAATQIGPLNLTLKYADYNADDYATDTRKIWCMAAATF